MVAARYVDERPVSVKSVSVLTGQSMSTVKRALRDCEEVKSYINLLDISKHSTRREAAIALAIMSKDKPAAYSIHERDGIYSVCRQLPNMYEIYAAKRLPIQKRPKELKALDHENMSNLDEKRYYKKASKKPVTHEHMQLGGTEITRNGMFVIWKPQNTKPKPKLRDKRSMAAKWVDYSKGVPKLSKKNDRNIIDVSE